jgi:hypothetical protein
MRRFEVLETPEGGAVRELPDEQSRVATVRKPPSDRNVSSHSTVPGTGA